MNTAVLEIEEPQTASSPAPLLGAGPAGPQQREAWEKFQSLPMPVRTDEHWRFANVKDLDIAPYLAPLPVDETVREDLLARSTGLVGAAGRMVFANDRLLVREELAGTLQQKGVLWLPLDQALA